MKLKGKYAIKFARLLRKPRVKQTNEAKAFILDCKRIAKQLGNKQ